MQKEERLGFLSTHLEYRAKYLDRGSCSLESRCWRMWCACCSAGDSVSGIPSMDGVGLVSCVEALKPDTSAVAISLLYAVIDGALQ